MSWSCAQFHFNPWAVRLTTALSGYARLTVSVMETPPFTQNPTVQARHGATSKLKGA
jgi:hypothetical protein